MSAQILIGKGKEIQTVPDADFLARLHQIPHHMAARLAFMTPKHHLVRDFVVREMPRQRRPISPGQISQVTGLGEAETAAILTELEQHLFFLVRDARGNVSWAFPVTTTRTAHRLTFSTGEHTGGA